MVEAKTQLILESIRKKMEKLEEPRTQANKDFSDIGDEFNYSAPTKKATSAQNVIAEEEKPAPLKPALTADEIAIEQEIDNSFQFDDEEENHDEHFEEQDANHEEHQEQETFEEQKDVTISQPEHLEEAQEENLENLQQENEDNSHLEEVQEEFHEEEVAQEIDEATSSNLQQEDEEVKETFDEEILELENEEHHDDFNFDHEAFPDIDLEEVEEKNEEDHKSDEDELEELLKEEENRKITEKPVDSSARAAVAQQSKTKQETILFAESNQEITTESFNGATNTPKKTFVDMNEFLNHKDSKAKTDDSLLNPQIAGTITDSIKKLVDAKNVVSGVTSFSKSEAFGDIAAQLMEPRLEKWLNENLPNLVEKIVREEIRKIIPKE